MEKESTQIEKFIVLPDNDEQLDVLQQYVSKRLLELKIRKQSRDK
jgi:hypothetical protein